MALPSWTQTNPVSVSLLTLAEHFLAVWSNVFHGLRSTDAAGTTPNDAASYPLANASKLTGKETGGTERNLAHMDASNDVRIGDTATDTILQAVAQPTWWDGTTSLELLDDAYITSAETALATDTAIGGGGAEAEVCDLTVAPGRYIVTALIRVGFEASTGSGTYAYDFTAALHDGGGAVSSVVWSTTNKAYKENTAYTVELAGCWSWYVDYSAEVGNNTLFLQVSRSAPSGIASLEVLAGTVLRAERIGA